MLNNKVTIHHGETESTEFHRENIYVFRVSNSFAF